MTMRASFQIVEDFAVAQLCPEAGIEALHITVLPGRAWRDVRRLGTDDGNPVPDDLGNELRSIVGSDVFRRAAQDEQVREGINDVDRIELSTQLQLQTLPAELIENDENAIGLAVMVRSCTKS